MGTDTAYSLAPALATFPRTVSRIVEPAFPRRNRENQTDLRKYRVKPREVAIFTGNLGQPRGTYNTSSQMTYPSINAAGRIVNIYV